MKKILALLLVLSSCTPVQYIMVDPKDSTKFVEVRTRIIYQDVYEPHIPMYFYNNMYSTPSYRPIIIQRPIVIPRTNDRPLPPRPPRKY